MVEFVSYNGSYPSLCWGDLVLKINGEEKVFRHALISGGNVSFDDDWTPHVEKGKWGILLPSNLEPLRKEIEDCINRNVPLGCCGGCV